MQSPWTTEILLNQVKVSFKLDTGAEVTTISDDSYRQDGLPKLSKPSKVLYGPARQKLDAVGQFTATLEHKRSNSEQVVFVLKVLRNNLLGLFAIIDQAEAGGSPVRSLLTTQRPHTTAGKVQEELNRMETLGVILKIHEPTPWCAGMVVVPKRFGAVRICHNLLLEILL